MWDEIVRGWQVEVALWVCYWNALDRERSGECTVLCRSQLDAVGVLAGGAGGGVLMLGMVVQFLQGGCR